MIDWKLYARTDKLFLKKYDERVTAETVLFIDISQSMSFGSLISKSVYARYCAAVLSILTLQQGDALTVHVFHETVKTIVGRSRTRKSLPTLFTALRDEIDSGASNGEALAATTNDIRESIVFFITDLWFDEDEFMAMCKRLRMRRNEVYIIQIHDRTEQELSNDTAATILDSESRKSLICSLKEIQGLYRQEYEKRQSYIDTVCNANGIRHCLATPDDALNSVLYHVLR